MKNNILLMIDSLTGGGAEVSTLRLAEAFLKRNYKVHLIIMKDVISFEVNENIELYCLNFQKKYISGFSNLYYAYQLKKVLKSITTEYGGVSLVLGSLGLTHKLMNIINSDNFFYMLHSTISQGQLGNRKGIQRFIKVRKIKNLYNKKNLLTVSEGIKKDILSLGVSPLSIEKIYNIFDFELLKKLANEKPSVVIPKSYLVHVGRLSKEKRHDILIRAFHELHDQSLMLLLVGTGDEENNIRQLVKDLELDNRVIFIGFQKNPYPFIKFAKALILSSDHEGLPTVLIESLVLNTLAISTNSPGASEILCPELEKCLCKIGSFKSLSSVIKENISNPVENFSQLLHKFDEAKIMSYYEGLIKKLPVKQ